MRIGGKQFNTEGKTYVMGILNVTPDSFSDGGRYNTLDRALFHAEEMIGEGADILDVGGESTRPGYRQITAEEEADRVVPVVAALKERFAVPISIDTYKSSVAKAALKAGADLVNDIWGLRRDPDMAGVIARSGAACCLTHNREKPEYTEFVPEVLADLEKSVTAALQAGVKKEDIILDPGIGFGKTREMNLKMLKNLKQLKTLGYPVLLGASRKSVIGLTLDLPVSERAEGTIVTTVFGVLAGCSFVRVHDVAANVRAVRMTEAILGEHE